MITEDSLFTVNYIADVDVTRNFWKVLGGEIVRSEDDKVVVKIAQLELHYILESTEPFADYHFATERKGRGQGTLFYFMVDDLEKFNKTVIDLNPTTLTPIKLNHWGYQEFMFSDPDGYLFVAYGEYVDE